MIRRQPEWELKICVVLQRKKKKKKYNNSEFGFCTTQTQLLQQTLLKNKFQQTDYGKLTKVCIDSDEIRTNWPKK